LAVRDGVGGATWYRHLGQYIERARAEAIDLDWVQRRFTEIAPATRCIDLNDALDPTRLEGCSLREVRRLILNAARGRTGFARFGRTEATVLAPGGTPRALLLVPPGPSNSPTWRAQATELLRLAEVAMTLGLGHNGEPSGRPGPNGHALPWPVE